MTPKAVGKTALGGCVKSGSEGFLSPRRGVGRGYKNMILGSGYPASPSLSIFICQMRLMTVPGAGRGWEGANEMVRMGPWFPSKK